jgi:hypothetical protein
MHIEETADAVASSMGVIETSLKQALPGENIKVATPNLRISRPDDFLEVEDAFEHSGVGFFLELCGFLRATEMAGSRDICSAIKILATRVQQVDVVITEFKRSFFVRCIMNDSSIWTSTRNGGK